MDISAEKIPARRGRTNPTVVKKPRSKFPSKKPIHRKVSIKLEPLTFAIINTA